MNRVHFEDSQFEFDQQPFTISSQGWDSSIANALDGTQELTFVDDEDALSSNTNNLPAHACRFVFSSIFALILILNFLFFYFWFDLLLLPLRFICNRYNSIM